MTTLTSSENERDSRSVFILFKGENEEEWDEWLGKFEAIGRKKGWWSALLNEDTLNEASTDKDMIKKVKLNAEAYYHLMMTCKGTAYHYIVNCENNANAAWTSLKERFEDLGSSDLLKLNEVLNKMKFPENIESEDPKLCSKPWTKLLRKSRLQEDLARTMKNWWLSTWKRCPAFTQQ